MTRSEAIKELQSYAEHSWGDLNDVFEMAISALRQQETVAKCNDLFDEDGGDILPDETVTDRHQMTNADRIRSMSDEDLAEFLDLIWGISSKARRKGTGNTLKWLQRPAEEDDHA